MSSSRSDDDPRSPVDPAKPLLDRSRARLRLPAEQLTPAVELAREQAMAHLRPGEAPAAPRSAKALADLMVAGEFDPIAAELLHVVGQASLLVAIDVSYGPDASAATIWATPRQAVMSSPIDPSQIVLEMVAVSQLPHVLAQMVVLQSPGWVGGDPISVGVETLASALRCPNRDEAADVLAGDGLNTEEALLLLDLHLPQLRRWRISSSWSTESGPDEAELVGVEAGPSGQWLESTSPGQDGRSGIRTFTPLGHGEAMSALRTVLPRNWMGTPLQPRPS